MIKTIIFLALLSSRPVYAKCADLEKAADLLDTKSFIKASKLRRVNEGSSEIPVQLSDINHARNYVYGFRPLKDLGFGMPSSKGWTPYKSTMNSSMFKDMRIGYTKKLDNGDFARIRFDWDEKKGAHYNIEITVKSDPLRKGTHKMAVAFDCAGAPCTKTQAMKMAKKINN